MSPQRKLKEPQGKREAESRLAADRHRLPPASESDIAFVGILLSIPVMLIAVVALIVVGWPLLTTLLMAFGLQILTFCVVLVAGLLRAKDYAMPQSATADNSTAPERAHIWRVFPSRGKAESSLRIALVSHDTEHSRDIATDLAELHHEVHHSTDRYALLESVQARPEEWHLVIFDLDLVPDLGTGMDDLLDFRMVCSEMPVLLLSSAVLRHDFSPHRRLIGDATLRKPVFREKLIEGMEAANLNFKSPSQKKLEAKG